MAEWLRHKNSNGYLLFLPGFEPGRELFFLSCLLPGGVIIRGGGP